MAVKPDDAGISEQVSDSTDVTEVDVDHRVQERARPQVLRVPARPGQRTDDRRREHKPLACLQHTATPLADGSATTGPKVFSYPIHTPSVSQPSEVKA